MYIQEKDQVVKAYKSAQGKIGLWSIDKQPLYSILNSRGWPGLLLAELKISNHNICKTSISINSS
jgi:hypothetical protein